MWCSPSNICTTNGSRHVQCQEIDMRFDQASPEPLAGALGFLLSWNGQRIRHRFAAALEPLGLRPQHFGVLQVIAAQPGTAQNELVARSMIDPSTMVKLIDE